MVANEDVANGCLSTRTPLKIRLDIVVAAIISSFPRIVVIITYKLTTILARLHSSRPLPIRSTDT